MRSEEEPVAPRTQADRAIDGLYVAFSCHSLGPTSACPCCVGPEDQEKIHALPLRQLTAEDLGRYAFKAMTTWGNQTDFKHFLPRLIELLRYQESASEGIGVELVLHKIAMAHPQLWPENQRAALDRALFALFREALSAYPAPFEIEPYLVALAPFVPDRTAYLKLFDDDTIPALRHLADLVMACQDLLWTGRRHALSGAEVLGPAGWQWLLSAGTRARLERGFFEHADADFAGELSRAVSCFDWAVPP